jgi:hypothetical protein
MTWGKFASILGLAGALAVDSVRSDYPEGVAELVETFGLLVEQQLGEWILTEGGGWEGFIKLNVYKATLPPVPRTIIIIFIAAIVTYFLFRSVAFIAGNILSADSDQLLPYQLSNQWKLTSSVLSHCPKPNSPTHFIQLSMEF